MGFSKYSEFLRRDAEGLSPGPVALILAEDDVGVGATIRHHARLGFKSIIVLAGEELDLPHDCTALCHRVEFDFANGEPVHEVINQAIDAFAGRWIYWCYSAEFLHFPFCESRSIEELIAFVGEERRNSAFTYVIDLYAKDLDASPLGYSLESAQLDASGYYALTRHRNGEEAERQLSIYGGLKWRFEDLLPQTKRRIDRVALFRATKGLTMDEDLLLSDEELNTYQCPWHHSVTIAICSFRTAKYLKANPSSTFEINDFTWAMSEKFHWNSQQLMDLGFMEPGQWF